MNSDNNIKEVVFCKKCVMSNQRPGSTVEFKNIKNEKKFIPFNQSAAVLHGACEFKVIKDTEIDWQEESFFYESFVEKYRSRNGSHDVVIPGSGGKDGTFTNPYFKIQI